MTLSLRTSIAPSIVDDAIILDVRLRDSERD